VRIPVLLLTLILCSFATLRSQTPNPGAQQDAEAAREKLLKAADQLDNIQANSESTKASVDGMKTDVTSLQTTVTKLQEDNAALRQQLTDLQASLDQYKAEQIKARQVLIDNVADMIAAGKGSSPAKSPKKKKEDSTPEAAKNDPAPAKKHDASPGAASLAPPPDASQGDATPAPDAPPEPKPQKGYYHVVADGETLTLICEAYRENGVNVTVSEIRKANGLNESSSLKPGQKLFIPKPGA
jgi:regulator of replication initiation timing